MQVLRRKGKRLRPHQETRGRFTVGTSIRQRPKEVRKRLQAGHWELDTVVSGRGRSKGCVAPFIERTTRYYVAVSMKDRCASSMQSAFATGRNAKRYYGSGQRVCLLSSAQGTLWDHCVLR